MSFPRYKSYKDSGVEWLGEVPKHWQVCTIKSLCNTITDGAHVSPETENGMYCFVSTKDLTEEGIDFENCLRTSKSSYEFLVANGCRPHRGDVLFSKDGTIGRTAVILEEREFVVASSLIIIRPDSCHLSTGFLNWLCQSNVVRNQVDSLVKGAGLPRLSIRNLLKVIGVFPPLEEQASITSFLDPEAHKIDTLVNEQKNLIDLLKEKRQAVISHAVTKGLDQKVPMKDSGVEWLGKVPEHWSVVRLANLFAERTEEGSPDLPILSVSIHHGVSDEELPEEELDRKVTRSEDRSKYKKVQPGDLVYNMMRAWQGGFGSVTVTGMVSPAYVVARPVTTSATELIEHILRTPTAVEEMRRHSRGITDFRLRLYWEKFKCIQVALPPRDEQTEILNFIARETARIKDLLNVANHSIDILMERRSALISAAVTGKIDVRDFVQKQEEAA